MLLNHKKFWTVQHGSCVINTFAIVARIYNIRKADAMSNITTIRTPNQWLSIAPEVESALTGKQPAVGFETTVLSFGLPYPSNLQVGRQCEKLAREAGCVPATLGMLDGKVHVGITDEQMQIFCKLGSDATKVNLQNMAVAVQRKQAGAFTVAASVQVCAEAGIRIFATGGVGGVHHDFTTFHDVSSDMIALARHPVAVVCAGVKSILDVPATIEHLETLGVPIIGYKTEHFPLFHARSSSYPVETHSDSMEEVAAIEVGS